MDMAKATIIQACVFVDAPSSKVFVEDGSGNIVDVLTEKLSDREAAAYTAMQDAFNMAVGKHGAFNYENHICPWDYGQNNYVMSQNGLFTFPTAIITATYPDGTGKRYVLGKETLDKLFGGVWDAQKLYPYIAQLLFDRPTQPDSRSMLCRLLPPLCSIGGWAWLALALAATAKASSSKGLGRAAWGTGAALLWNEWASRGGLQQLKNTFTKP